MIGYQKFTQPNKETKFLKNETKKLGYMQWIANIRSIFIHFRSVAHLHDKIYPNAFLLIIIWSTS